MADRAFFSTVGGNRQLFATLQGRVSSSFRLVAVHCDVLYLEGPRKNKTMVLHCLLSKFDGHPNR